MKISILIPAYKPDQRFIHFVRQLAEGSSNKVVVIDDGSGTDFGAIFVEAGTIPNVTVISHQTNKGKGAALKTGSRFIYDNMADFTGIVTADADGQHRVEDILRVASALEQNPEALVMGARTFSGDIPLRSKFGNILTRTIFRLLYKINISDTQTGLRGIQRSMIPSLLHIPYDRYEFETEMLMTASRNNIKIVEIPIETIYEDGNASSHFNPFRDSVKIYFVLLRYTLASLFSALIDFIVFVTVYPLIGNVLVSTYASRAVSLFVNYGLVSKAVFYSDSRIRETFPKYLLLVIISGSVSSLLILLMNRYASIPIDLAKIVSESVLYITNFYIQKKFIFTKSSKQ